MLPFQNNDEKRKFVTPNNVLINPDRQIIVICSTLNFVIYEERKPCLEKLTFENSYVAENN